MTPIGSEICPACGLVVWLVRLHTGLTYFHGAYGDSLCLGEVFVRAGDAEAVRRIRERRSSAANWRLTRRAGAGTAPRGCSGTTAMV